MVNVLNLKPKFSWNKVNFGQEYDELVKRLKPKLLPNDFHAGHVITTKFDNISYIVDFKYTKESNDKPEKFWNVVRRRPPCQDANDYAYKYILDLFYVEIDEFGNNYWCERFGDGYVCPLQHAYKFMEGTHISPGNGSTWMSVRNDDDYAGWAMDENEAAFKYDGSDSDASDDDSDNYD